MTEEKEETLNFYDMYELATPRDEKASGTPVCRSAHSYLKELKECPPSSDG